MLILGIDPGTATTGYGLIEKTGQKITPVEYSCWRTPAGLPMPQRLLMLSEFLEEVLGKYSPSHLVVEELFFNRNVTTVISVGQARGVILLAAAKYKIPAYEYTPLQVKQAVAGYGKATKQQVQYMVKAILGLKECPKPDDTADALAIGICHAFTIR
ncbi:Crossover junction endodeoxyribonuclease ruvC [Syntrophobotulus glycolicus DSM 8271]|uniref:Crossover junction endodeoxyribonuclease RuvC n=1 Tax=Syntrophobotulus glycolicus (strain DSM 8271 / FlGlyR) TaxID=645991 RepID=F0T269_SYNGF|nr:crossover junction endodeoxyribonuclease RuvC [Syntrophobotulus glycolicus]ADY56413.1 Crossover junction endodeoxyribonuclease ruvC [Syntrophobotulus glycolicus DSM 8271]